MAERAPAICEPGGFGMIPPLTSSEQYWPRGLRGFLYALALAHCFLGAGIVADTLMGAIETVTNRRRQVQVAPGRRITSWAWNETVAKFSLIALGSSALEISISCLSVFKERLHFSELGASTAVGSGAVCLLLVGAMCMVAVPPGESRQIKETCICYTSAFFSILASLWLVFILVICTPDVVDVWEGIVTFLFCPLFLGASYQAERGFDKLPADMMQLSADLCLTARRWRRWTAARLPSKLRPQGAGEPEESAAQAAQAVQAVQVGAGDQPDLSAASLELGNYITFASEGGAVECLTVHSSSEAVTTVEVTVRAPQGASGPASCMFRTERLTAVPGYDFEEAEGTLHFTPELPEQRIQLTIPQRDSRKAAREFLLILEEPAGARFDPTRDGGSESAILTVTVAAGDPPAGSCDSKGPWFRRLDTAVNVDAVRYGCRDWLQQLRASAFCNGSWEAQKHSTRSECLRHFVAFPWKVAGALVPPTSLFGGWACFWGALGLLIFVAILIIDFAQLFGCVCDIPDCVMGITFVALGVCVPDLLASLLTTRAEHTADGTFVRLTTKNTVNIFFGLGVPWTMGALHWKDEGRTGEWLARHMDFDGRTKQAAFVVDSPALAFVVITLCILYIASFWLVHLRRVLLGGELGGPLLPRLTTSAALVLFWGGYVAIGSYRAKSWDEATFGEQGATIGGIAVAEAFVVAFAAAAICGFRWRELLLLLDTVRPSLPAIPVVRSRSTTASKEAQQEAAARSLEEKEALRFNSPLRPQAPAVSADAGAASAGAAAADFGTPGSGRRGRPLVPFQSVCPGACGSAKATPPEPCATPQ